VLLEREAELAAVDELTARARSGRGGLAVVTGALGAGRTAMLSACAERASGTVLSARGIRAEHGYAFGVARQLVEEALDAAVEQQAGDLDRFAVDFRPDDPDGDPDDVTPASAAALHGAYDVLGERVRRVAADGPVLVLVDDLHWCDTPSLHWLAHLARRLENLPVVAVVAVRDGDGRADGPLLRALHGLADRVLPLAPLTERGVASLVERSFGRPGDATFTASVTEVSGGVPLVARCVLSTLHRSGATPDGDAVAVVSQARPEALRTHLATCLRGLPGSVRRYLHALAALTTASDRAAGRSPRPDTDLLGRLAGLDDTDGAAAHRVATRLGLVRAGPELAHPAIGDAVDDLLGPEDRETMHLRAADALHAVGADSERVGRHLLAVPTPNVPWAVGALRTAATVARRRGDPRGAARFLRHALLARTTDEADRGALLLELAIVERGVDMGVATRRLLQAETLLPSLREKAEALAALSAPALEDATPATLAELRRVTDLLGTEHPPGDPCGELALALEARVRYADRHDPVALAVALERLDGLETGPGLPLGTAGGRELTAVLMFAAVAAGRWDAARVTAVAGDLLRHEPASPDHVHGPLVLVVRCLCLADAADGLLPWLERALEIARTEQADTAEAVVRAEIAAVLLHSGRRPEAEHQMARAWALLTDTLVDDPLLPGLLLAPVAAALPGSVVGAELLARYDGHLVDPAALGVPLQLLRARTRLRAGDLEAALEDCLDCGRRYERSGWVGTFEPWRAWAVALLRRLGRDDEARALADEDRGRARAWGAPARVGRALRLCGELADGEESGRLLQESVAVLRASHDRQELGRALRALGRHLAARGEPGGTEHQLEGDRIGADGEPDDLLELPVRESPGPGPAVGSRHPGSGSARPITSLTRTEHRVVEMAAEGRTNQDIAAAMDVSVRAVEKHLTAAYRKLGISGRVALLSMWGGGSDLTA
jgi:DNA-binding CsgD family transcriptional regulator